MDFDNVWPIAPSIERTLITLRREKYVPCDVFDYCWTFFVTGLCYYNVMLVTGTVPCSANTVCR